MTDFVRVDFKLYATKMAQFNSAMLLNLKNAITGTYPDYTITFFDDHCCGHNVNGYIPVDSARCDIVDNPIPVGFTRGGYVDGPIPVDFAVETIHELSLS